MRFVSGDSQRLIFQGRRAARGALIIGIAFIGVALSPIVYGDARTTLRWFTSVVAAAVATVFIRAGWPRARRVVLVCKEGQWRLDGDSTAGKPTALHLDSRLDEDEFALYRVDLDLETGRHTLLQSSEPETVLRDLASVARFLELPIVSGWGLPADAHPWAAAGDGDGPHPDASAPVKIDMVLPQVAYQREIGWTVIIGGVVVATIAIFQIAVRLSRGDQPTAMDLILPLLLVGTIEGIGLAVLTKALRLSMNGVLSVEWRVFGFVHKRRAIAKDAVRAVYVVGPHQLPPTHVLLDTAQGPFAIASGQRSAREVAAVIERTL